MKKSLLFSVFLLLSSLSIVVTGIASSNESYAYSEETVNPVVRFYYLDGENVLEDEKAYFQIFDNEKLITSFETFIGNDYVEINLEVGEYRIHQIRGSDTYEILEDEVINVLETNEVQNIYLEPIKTNSYRLAINVIDIATNYVVSDAEFHLVDEEQTLIDTCTTTTGYCYFNDLEPKKYILENVIAPDGYATIDPVNIEITKTIDYLSLFASPLKLKINVLDENTRNQIKDFQLKVYDLTHNLILELDNKNEISHLKAGSYYLECSRIKDGYENNKEKIYFDLEDSKKMQTLDISFKRLNNENNIFLDIIYLSALMISIICFVYLILYYRKYNLTKKSHSNNRK